MTSGYDSLWTYTPVPNQEDVSILVRLNFPNQGRGAQNKIQRSLSTAYRRVSEVKKHQGLMLGENK